MRRSNIAFAHSYLLPSRIDCTGSAAAMTPNSEIAFPSVHSALIFLLVVVVLLLYVHGKHLRSCRDGQLT